MTTAPDYDHLAQALRKILPAERLLRDPLRTLAYGTDASFYRLIPRIVAIVDSEAEVVGLLRACRDHGAPVTFRAAGTSLSGQAISDSVLAVLGDGWSGCAIAADAATIRLQPGVVGAEANRRLAPHGRKIGPDPASINAARIGGIAANNASGMCCGTAQNSYRTLRAMRLILADGTLLDTGCADSRAAFARSHRSLLAALEALAARTKADTILAERIRKKFRIKNTTGYSLNALLDFDDPFEVLQHLTIGSEGTLGFIAEITYDTVPEHPLKASALLSFPDIAAACRAVAALKHGPVAAVELMDRAALRSVEGRLPPAMAHLPKAAAALLVETRAETPDALRANIAAVTDALAGHDLLTPAAFTADPAEAARLWTIRKGLFPSVGAVRALGTTVIIEDVAVPVADLAAAALDLQALFARHGYHEAIIFGHALDGNLHFVFTQDFGIAAEVERYSRFMDDVCRLLVGKYDGSLKAEHGTGRNMAPFVELEWGRDATRLMHGIKALLDPDGLLNPGVVLSTDPRAHLKDLKPLPAADPLVDKCIECGFCEPLCPSRGLTLTPRQRITVWRQMATRDDELRRPYQHFGIDTCAGCGLCGTVCPVAIDTGRFIRSLRAADQGAAGRRVGAWAARHYGGLLDVTRAGLRVAGWGRALLGARGMNALGGFARRVSGGRLPLVTAALPSPMRYRPAPKAIPALPRVVYVPGCASRSMGPAADAGDRRPMTEVTVSLLEKAGYQVVSPEGLDGLCCGQAFASKGLPEVADAKAAEMAAAMRAASEDGALPVVMDASPCTLRMTEHLAGTLPLFDLPAFIAAHVLDRITVRRRGEPVALHVTCGARRLGEEAALTAIAQACAETVVVPDGVSCCGFAGDKGFTHPELNAHALRPLAAQVAGCAAGYSSNRTCEIGLSQHGGIPYQSIVYLVESCAEAMEQSSHAANKLAPSRHSSYLVPPNPQECPDMARKKPVPNKAFVLFDVVYEDGTRSSNRKVASGELAGLDGDAPAKALIEAQDREIAIMSGNPRGPIKIISRSPNQ